MTGRKTAQKQEETAAEGFETVLREMMRDPRILQMRNFPQHGSCNTYDHSVNVALCAHRLARLLHLGVNERALARGAMLHDFYLYNIQESGKGAWEHGTTHPEVALRNAERFYQLTPMEKDLIYSHMWPLTLTHVPHYRESVIVSLADKYCATKERTLQGWSFARRMKERIVG